MGATAASLPRRLTPEEYLEIEERAEYKSEYWQGYVYAMSGASFAHVLISSSLYELLGPEARRNSCRSLTADMKIWVEEESAFFYPDASVLCGKPRFRGKRNDVIENPAVIIEILSDSTERYDRGRKFRAYRTIPELRHYVLIAQDEPQVEVYTRNGEEWVLHTFRGLPSVARLPLIDASLPLADLYRDVEFPPPQPSPDPQPVTE
jgi:Uma2 family endonuclease